MQSFYGPEMIMSQNASKMDTSLAWFPANADHATFEMLEDIGWDNIYDINDNLRQYFASRLEEEGIQFNNYGKDKLSNAITIPVSDLDLLKTKLKEKNIITSVRMGNLRASVHFYNSKDHIDQLINVLKK
jgi:selenocysteine lyase/cysteine desulfurase